MLDHRPVQAVAFEGLGETALRVRHPCCHLHERRRLAGAPDSVCLEERDALELKWRVVSATGSPANQAATRHQI
jgi:hypothetical protein